MDYNDPPSPSSDNCQQNSYKSLLNGNNNNNQQFFNPNYLVNSGQSSINEPLFNHNPDMSNFTNMFQNSLNFSSTSTSNLNHIINNNNNNRSNSIASYQSGNINWLNNGDQNSLNQTSSPQSSFSSPSIYPNRKNSLLSNTFSSLNDGLPNDLQGGISNINSRRPSYAAEVFNRTGYNDLNVSIANNNNASKGFHDFNLSPPNTAPLTGSFNRYNFQNIPHTATGTSFSISESPYENEIKKDSVNLDNGLLLVNNRIVTSPELRQIYRQANKYFCQESAEKVYNGIKLLLDPTALYAPKISNLVNFLKRKNDINNNSLNYHHHHHHNHHNHNQGNNNNNKSRTLCLVCSKSGKVDVLTVSSNSNILLQKHDLVVIEGDRGKDLVYIIEPTIGLNFVVLLNFLKKREHIKSMNTNNEKLENNNINIGSSNKGGANYDQDDEHVISLPTKQVLRFATSQEVEQLGIKLKEELMAFKVAIEKVKSLNNKPRSSTPQLNLKIFNSEFQFDKKKLIFYYSCNKRNDFRDLIKELFKIYKTRIWLCAILNPDEFNPYNESNILSRESLLNQLTEFENNFSQTYFNENNNNNSNSLINHSVDLSINEINEQINNQRNEHYEKKYQERVDKIVEVDLDDFRFENITIDDFHSQNLLNSIENLKIDLNIN